MQKRAYFALLEGLYRSGFAFAVCSCFLKIAPAAARLEIQHCGATDHGTLHEFHASGIVWARLFP